MTDDGPIRKLVKPAHPDARIPDPDRRRYLPPEGQEVDWNAHWAAMQVRGDVLVSDIAAAAPAKTEPAKTDRPDEPEPDYSQLSELPSTSQIEPSADRRTLSQQMDDVLRRP